MNATAIATSTASDTAAATRADAATRAAAAAAAARRESVLPALEATAAKSAWWKAECAHDPAQCRRSLSHLLQWTGPGGLSKEAGELVDSILAQAAEGPDGGFPDKNSWLRWRALWRAAYAALTATIRKTRGIARDSSKADSERSSAQGDLLPLRRIARTLMEIRAAARAAAVQERLLLAAQAAARTL